MNYEIMQAKQDIANIVNEKLKQDIPVAALILIFESVLGELGAGLNMAIQKEKELVEENQND